MSLDLYPSARWAVRQGWSVFPLVPNKKTPLTRHGFKNASRDERQINAWWHFSPEANIGIATGMKSRIAVVDIDVKNGKRGPESAASIRGFLDPATLTVMTPTGGIHYYYTLDTPLPGVIGLMNGLDIKADGGYIVAPGSMIDGKEYKLKFDLPLKPFSPFLRAEILRKPPPPPPVERSQRQRNGQDDHVHTSNGNWHVPMLKATASLVARGLSDEEILSRLEGHALAGYTIDHTRQELIVMIRGARAKGYDRSGRIGGWYVVERRKL